jgi:hypothetical protein
VDHFREWITKHIDSWFALTQKYRLGLKIEDILLVTGCHRTRSWSNVAFPEAEVNKTFSVKVDIAGASIKWDGSKVNFPGALHNHGPSGEVCVADYMGHQKLKSSRPIPLGLV